MEEEYISISTLNDFIFCPYSIYLHNVYMGTDEGLYHATPQTKGRNAHETIDTKTASNRADDLQSFPVMSEKYKFMGKIDIYRGKEKELIKFYKLFTGADSVLIFDAPNAKVQKYGNAIHRDSNVVYL